MARENGKDSSADTAFRRPRSGWRRAVTGFTLIELVITATVLSILTLGVMPLVQVAVKRQREQQLRDELREIRAAIDQFHREALAAPQSVVTGVVPALPNQVNQNQNQNNNVSLDPRIRVYVSDPKIFTVDNPDRYPPDLDTLVKGVDVIPIQANGMGGQGMPGVNATDLKSETAIAGKKKVYLRSLPIDPITGKGDWVLRSCYDASDASSWGGENVFNVHSKSNETALNGEKYSDW